jgi:hypothetical protein
MDSLFSFPVGLFHPLQHAGLSRRSTYNRETVLVPSTLVQTTPLVLFLIGYSGNLIDCY